MESVTSQDGCLNRTTAENPPESKYAEHPPIWEAGSSPWHTTTRRRNASLGPDPRRTIETHRNVPQYAHLLTQHPCEIDAETEPGENSAPKYATQHIFHIESWHKRHIQSTS